MVDPLQCNLILFEQPVRGAGKHSIHAEYREVLLRVECPDGFVHLPGELLELAQQKHCMPLLDRQIITLLFEYLYHYEDPRSFGVNISAQTLEENDDFFEWLLEQIREYKLDPKKLVFEINENSIATSQQSVIEGVGKLRKIGCLIALDDFARGYLSPRDIRLLKPDYIKIDSSFIKDLIEQINKATVLYIVQLANISGALSIAEGVEQAHQYNQIKELNVDMVQGFIWQYPKLLYSPKHKIYPCQNLNPPETI